MREERITLTKTEHERLVVVRQVLRRELKQKVAAELLSFSTRQVQNLVRKVERDGAKGLAHGNRGKSSPKRMAQTLVDRIIALVKERYRDFKPKFAAEKLWKRDKIRVSDEKMRQIMIGAGLWRVHRQKSEVHPWREPKVHCGEMVQMDGSHHAWLETRGPKLVMMGMVDDARNRFYGRFYAYKGAYPAMNVLGGYIRRFGLPRSLYVDKHSTYKTGGLMLGKPATVMLHFDGRMVIRYEGRDFGFREIAERTKRIPAVPVVWPKPPKYNPPPTHLWKVYRGPAESDTSGRA